MARTLPASATIRRDIRGETFCALCGTRLQGEDEIGQTGTDWVVTPSDHRCVPRVTIPQR